MARADNGTRSLLSYAGRFIVPLLLLAAAVTAWIGADRLGNTDTRAASVVPIEHVETPLTSIRRVPEVAVASADASRSDQVLAALPADPGGLSCAVVLLDGVPVLSIRPDRALVGGYAQLLFAAHAALDVLGPGYVYETQLLARDLPDAAGRIAGAIYLIGAGDPVLMTNSYALGLRPALSTRTAVEDLVAVAVDAGLERVDGGVVGVERRYDTVRSLPGWPESFAAEGLLGPLSALQVDDGFAERASANLGVAVPAEFPATLAAERLDELLEASGVDVNGSNRTLDDGETLPSLVPVARIVSPPLSDIVFQTLAVNDATAAEMLVKELGAVTSDQGTTQAGGQVVQQVLIDLGVDVPVAFRDGSGLDPFGGATCAQLAGAADAIDAGHPTIAAFPAYDLPAVFDGRLQDLPVDADLRVVGGSVGDVSSIVGRTVDEGGRVSFASIVNRPGGPTESDLAFQRALVQAVDGLRWPSRLDAIEADE